MWIALTLARVMRRLLIPALSWLLLSVGVPTFAQDTTTTPPASSPEIELNLVNLPTTQSLARHRSYTRITHRFARDLGLGDFTDLAADLFSLDNGAVIGLEYRFGITTSLHAGLHRNTQNKTSSLGWAHASACSRPSSSRERSRRGSPVTILAMPAGVCLSKK